MKATRIIDIIKDGLLGQEYWFTTPPLKWATIAYLTSLIKSNPLVNRRTAMYYVTEDLDKLYIAFIDNENVKKHISNMQHTLKSPSKNDSEILNKFWQNHSNEIKELALKDNTNLSKVESSLKDTATSSITSKRKSPNQTTRSHPPKRQNVKETAHKTEECDGIYVCNNKYSVGTIINSNGIKVHEKLLNNETLTSRQRKIMTNRLSSILDLSDNSLASQRALFSENEWAEIGVIFGNRLKIKLEELSEKVTDTIKIITDTLELSGDYKCCIAFVEKEMELSACGTTVIALGVFKEVLKTMMRYPYMLTKPPSKKVTESNYLRCIWSSIFEALFPPESGRIRIKSGESINSASTSNKNEQYIEAKSIKSLKIDFRFLVDLPDGQEVDVATGEYALCDDDSRAIADEGKLTRESKDALDEILKISTEDLGTVEPG